MSRYGASAPVLSVEGLTTTLTAENSVVNLIADITFRVGPGEILGVVGETGSGKSLTALSILNLVRPPIRIAAGRAMFQGQDLVKMSERDLQEVRGKQIGVIFQAARSALHPMLRVGDQIGNVLRSHSRVSHRIALEQAIEMLAATRIKEPRRVASLYPHELSGGMAQRVLIASALICSPTLVVADEPTTGLDVTVQLQILRLLRDLLKQREAAAMIITHDLGVVANFCDHVIVMYGGRIMESGSTAEFFRHPRHPYSVGLLGAANLDIWTGHPELRLKTGVIDVLRPPAGCVLHPRCPLAYDRCVVEEPALLTVDGEHLSRCHLANQI